jgi:prolyl-tRNA synthetase
VQPAELWVESGRWEQYGPELLRVKDRHGRDFVLQPTSEEVITDIARNEIQSWRHLPVNFYHIQTKFRDERRPRFGVMRGREFTMKDAYSFDRDVAGAQKSYKVMFDAYMRIFERLGLTFRAVAADTGSIGGSQSHEFQVIADIGEDLIVYDPRSDYAANIELAPAPCLINERAAPGAPMQSVATPEATKCEMVAEMLKAPLSHTVKSIVLATEQDGKPALIWLLLLRGDHELNEIKVGKVAGLNKGFRFATEAEIIEHFGCKPGYLGPVATKQPVRVVADLTVAKMHDFICGANQEGAHLTGRTVRERSPSSAGLKSVMSFILARNTPKHSRRLFSMKMANRRSWRWAVTASVSHVS